MGHWLHCSLPSVGFGLVLVAGFCWVLAITLNRETAGGVWHGTDDSFTAGCMDGRLRCFVWGPTRSTPGGVGGFRGWLTRRFANLCQPVPACGGTTGGPSETFAAVGAGLGWTRRRLDSSIARCWPLASASCWWLAYAWCWRLSSTGILLDAFGMIQMIASQKVVWTENFDALSGVPHARRPEGSAD